MTDSERFSDAVVRARLTCANTEADDWADQVFLAREPILAAIEVFSRGAVQNSASTDNRFGLVVARLGRTGPATSIKPGNISREISRTVHAAALFGLVQTSFVAHPVPTRVLGALVGFAFAAFAATKATIGYNDAAVLHKAWQIAGQRPAKDFTSDELMAARANIASEYRAPKCAGEPEIQDVLENLLGLKAIERNGDRFFLKERIIFFANGQIKN